MNEEDTCPNGRADCDFAEKHELALAGKILRIIESYTKDNETYPCPKCLRNSMIAIAALLHLEAEKIDENDSEQISPDCGFVKVSLTPPASGYFPSWRPSSTSIVCSANAS